MKFLIVHTGEIIEGTPEIKATVISNKTKYPKGTVLIPKGFYYQNNMKKVVLVGDTIQNHTHRIHFKIEDIDIKIEIIK